MVQHTSQCETGCCNAAALYETTKALFSARRQALHIIICAASGLRDSTRTFAADICDFSCAGFVAEWHYADAKNLFWHLSACRAKRLHCRDDGSRKTRSLLADAYEHDVHSGDKTSSIFNADTLRIVCKAVACASLMLACILCNDYSLAESDLANTYVRTDDGADLIRRYGYEMFVQTFDGCVSSVPSVQTIFIQLLEPNQCSTTYTTTNTTTTTTTTALSAANYMQHCGVQKLLFGVTGCFALKMRYNFDQLAHCCVCLAAIIIDKLPRQPVPSSSSVEQILERVVTLSSVRKKRVWAQCFVDCLLAWQSASTEPCDVVMEVAAHIYNKRLFPQPQKQCRYNLRSLAGTSRRRIKRSRVPWIDTFFDSAAIDGWREACRHWRRLRCLSQHTGAPSPKFSMRSKSSVPLTTQSDHVLCCTDAESRQLLCYPDGNNESAALGSGTFGNVVRMQVVDPNSDANCSFENLLNVYTGKKRRKVVFLDAAEQKSNMNACSQLAVKRYFATSDKGTGLNDVADALQEINALLYCSASETVVNCVAAIFNTDETRQSLKNIFLCTPLYQCDMFSWLQRARTVNSTFLGKKECFVFDSVQHFCSVASQIAHAVATMHRHSLLHRDIKTPNLLVSADGQRVVLADCGNAVFLYPGTEDKQVNGEATTLWWRCPEHVLQRSHRRNFSTSTASDVWSLSVCIVEMCQSLSPFRHCENARQLLRAQWTNCSPNLSESDYRWHCGLFPSRNDAGTGRVGESALRKAVDVVLPVTEIVDFMFEKMLHFCPQQRASAAAVADFFHSFLKQ